MAHDLSQLLWVAGAAVGGGVGTFGLGIAVYVLVSFWLMGAHAARRDFGIGARELARELFWASVSQPFIPLYYLIGRRLGPRRDGTPVVFVHGYMQNRVDFVYLSRRLAARELGPMYGFNYPWWSSIPKNARRLDAFISKVCEETGKKRVDIVAHSMGGLVVMEMLRGEEERRIRRIVTIASPHAGVVWRGPIIGFEGGSMRRGSKLLEAQAAAKLAVPALSVYSTHDNIVHPKETSQLARRGGRDVEVEGPAHLAILFNDQVAAHVGDFLCERDMKISSFEKPGEAVSGNLESG
jgi:pimeloyl-ACP methyl ester carboxylesterase